MTGAGARLVHLAGTTGAAAALLRMLGPGATAGAVLAAYSGLDVAKASNHLLHERVAATPSGGWSPAPRRHNHQRRARGRRDEELLWLTR